MKSRISKKFTKLTNKVQVTFETSVSRRCVLDYLASTCTTVCASAGQSIAFSARRPLDSQFNRDT